jgi:hypothetical protein
VGFVEAARFLGGQFLVCFMREEICVIADFVVR